MRDGRTVPPEGQEEERRVVRAALAAARAGGGWVTAEQVERLARDKADAIAVARGTLPYGDISWACVRYEYIRPIRADLAALGIEVQR